MQWPMRAKCTMQLHSHANCIARLNCFTAAALPFASGVQPHCSHQAESSQGAGGAAARCSSGCADAKVPSQARCSSVEWCAAAASAAIPSPRASWWRANVPSRPHLKVACVARLLRRHPTRVPRVIDEEIAAEVEAHRRRAYAAAVVLIDAAPLLIDHTARWVGVCGARRARAAVHQGSASRQQRIKAAAHQGRSEKGGSEGCGANLGPCSNSYSPGCADCRHRST